MALTISPRSVTVRNLLHNLLSLPISHHCVWSGITGHNLAPEKRDNNYTPHALIPTLCLRTEFNLQLASVPVLGVCSIHFITRSSITVSSVSATL